jgi:hypothetical protein
MIFISEIDLILYDENAAYHFRRSAKKATKTRRAVVHVARAHHTVVESV